VTAVKPVSNAKNSLSERSSLDLVSIGNYPEPKAYLINAKDNLQQELDFIQAYTQE
jgi:hypothetical protein